MYKKFRKSKVMVTLGILLIFLPLFIQSSTEFKQIQINEKNGINGLKTSGVFTDILINDLLTTNTSTSGNWTWAVSQPWCSGSGTILDPYIIEGHIWNMSMVIDGLKIYNSHNKYFTVKNCTFKWNELTNTIPMTGIELRNTTHGQIIDNLAYHLGYGIVIEYCININITDNIIYDHIDGISILFSDLSTISGNTVDLNDIGIFFDTGFNNTIMGNTVDNNDIGIYFYAANNNTIIDNTVSNNDVSGIYFEEDSDYQEITENIIYNNTIGIYIDGLNHYNSVYKNFFLKNGKHAIDDETDNDWNSTIIGNYWDNHTGPDANSDGIVDNPYTFIGGSVGSIDYLPIAEDGAPRITINSPQEGEKFGSAAPAFNVEIVDIYVAEMWYTLGGGLNNYTFTGNGTINQTVWDALPEGDVTIRFYARDIVENVAFEEVTVIKSISEGGLDPGVIAIIVVVSVAGGSALIGAAYLFLKKRKAT